MNINAQFAVELTSEPFHGGELVPAPERHLISHRAKWPKEGIQLERRENTFILFWAHQICKIMNSYSFSAKLIKSQRWAFMQYHHWSYFQCPLWLQEYESTWEITFSRRERPGDMIKWEFVIFSMQMVVLIITHYHTLAKKKKWALWYFSLQAIKIFFDICLCRP